MARPHAKLRGAMVAADMDEEYLARKLLRGRTYVSQRMMGKKPWAMDEVYAIMDLLRLPHDQLAAYFPPKGA
jgi:hypothetical protein